MDATEIVDNAKGEGALAREHIREVADWFHEREGELFPRAEAREAIDSSLKLDVPNHLSQSDFVNDLISRLVGDHVDPVQQVPTANEKHVGVISYEEHGGYYTYEEFNDAVGNYIRGVCGACIHTSTKSSEPFTRHTGDFGKEPFGDEELLHKEMEEHVESCSELDELKTGATLASGTTIAGNTAVHSGNESFVDESGDTMSGTLTANGSPSVTTGGSIRVNTGSSIQDGSGTDRVEFQAGATQINDEDGSFALKLEGGSANALGAYSDTPATIFDSEASQTAVQYTTDASTGTLELSNADLSIPSANKMDITGSSSFSIDSAVSGSIRFRNNPSEDALVTDAESNGEWVIYDSFNNTPMLQVANSDPVRVLNRNLQMDTDQSIEDGSGNNAITIRSGGVTRVRSDLEGDGGEVIWDESNTHVPQGRLQNDSVTVNTGTDLTGGGTVALGASITVNHANTSGQGDVSTGGATVIDDIGVDGRGHVDNINTENRSLDQWSNANADVNFGNNRITAVNEIELQNIEDVGTAPVIGIDQSEGLLIDWGSGTAPALDGNNLSTGSNISLSDATGASTDPNLSLVQGSGSGLDADTVDGNEAADIGGGEWTLINSSSASNSNDFGTVSVAVDQNFDEYRFLWKLKSESEFGTSYFIRINNNTADDYEVFFQDGSNSGATDRIEGFEFVDNFSERAGEHRLSSEGDRVFWRNLAPDTGRPQTADISTFDSGSFDSIQFVDESGRGGVVTIKVFGRDV